MKDIFESDILKSAEKLYNAVAEGYAKSVLMDAGALENEFIKGLIFIGVKPTQILYATLYTDEAYASKEIVRLCERANDIEEADDDT